ncbi:MAG: hypothetical protein ACI9UQ_000692 [Candidatus Krumholzibacteriia bacterium]|jgi:hypothetical protein
MRCYPYRHKEDGAGLLSRTVLLADKTGLVGAVFKAELAVDRLYTTE